MDGGADGPHPGGGGGGSEDMILGLLSSFVKNHSLAPSARATPRECETMIESLRVQVRDQIYDAYSDQIKDSLTPIAVKELKLGCRQSVPLGSLDAYFTSVKFRIISARFCTSIT